MKQKDQLGLKDQLSYKKETLGEEDLSKIQRKSYEVISPSGIFKNGWHFKQGDQIQLDEKTAGNFLQSNDIKPV